MAIKQRFTYFFAGNDIDTDVWQFNDVLGTGSGAMIDAVNGGYEITSGTSAFDRSSISFNDKRPFSNTASMILGNVTRVGADTNLHFGLCNGNDNSGASTVDKAEINDRDAQTWKNLSTANGTTQSETASTIATNTSSTNIKIELKASSVDWEIDGIVQTAKTTHLPTAKLQPVFLCRSATAGAKTSRILNCEAFNT